MLATAKAEGHPPESMEREDRENGHLETPTCQWEEKEERTDHGMLTSCRLYPKTSSAVFRARPGMVRQRFEQVFVGRGELLRNNKASSSLRGVSGARKDGILPTRAQVLLLDAARPVPDTGTDISW